MSREFAKRIRHILTCPSEDANLTEFLDYLDAEVLEMSSSTDLDRAGQEFEEALQTIFHEDVDYSNLPHLDFFLQIILHSQPILPRTSIVTTWFDLLLRPTLRDPRMPSSTVEYAKQLVIQSLQDSQDGQDIFLNFRRQLVDLFLWDVLNNELSREDILEWAHLNEEQRQKNSWWKSNLEDVLVRYGLLQAEEFMNTLNDYFKEPDLRLQILSLMDAFVSHPSFLDISVDLFNHPMLRSILLSLEVDQSSTVCAVELALVIKLFPVVAIRSCEYLKADLPRLYAILGRILCWKSLSGSIAHSSNFPHSGVTGREDFILVSEVPQHEVQDDGHDFEGSCQVVLRVREEIGWIPLQRTFDMSTSSLPVPKQFFTFLYYLFPCNMIQFLRGPTAYLQEAKLESPWTVGWEVMLDDFQIRAAGEALLRLHIFHPLVLSQDAKTELASSSPWSSYDVSRIVGECMALDSSITDLHDRSTSTHLFDEGNQHMEKEQPPLDIHSSQDLIGNGARLSVPLQQRTILLDDLIAASAALKSGADFLVSDSTPVWPSILFTPPSSIPRRQSNDEITSFASISTSSDEMKISAQVREMISGLQREVLLLRTELNFELWLKRENLKHISRLRHDGIMMKSAELQQQRLQNRLRDYRNQLLELQKQLITHQDQTQLMKKKNNEWNEELTSKLNDLREQKKTQSAEVIALRKANTHLKTQLAAQGKLLDDAETKVFQLQTEIKQDAHKIQRLRDYEKRIEQLTAMHQMWNRDINLYNAQSAEMTVLISEYQKMKSLLEAHEKAQEDAEATARSNRQKLRELLAALRTAERAAYYHRPEANKIEHLQETERDTLSKAITKLRHENDHLNEEVDELKAEIESLRAQKSR